MKKVLQILILSLVMFSASAQDPHLSQFYAAPLYLNPALTGAFSGNYRLSGLFRGQWGSVLANESVPMYRTYTFSADFRTNRGFAKEDAFGFGASFLGDHAGEAKFGYNRFGLSMAYHKSLNRRATNFLVLGFQSEIYNQTLDPSRLQFGTQWNPGTSSFDPNLIGEAIPNDNLLYWDVSTGMMWYMNFGKNHYAEKRSNVYLGVSAYHLNRPKISLLNDESVRLNIKFVGHGGIRFPLAGRFDLQPKFIVMFQGKSIETVWAADLRILFEEREPNGNNFRFGTMFRMVGGDNAAAWRDQRLNPEAVVLTAGVDWNGLSVNAGYDINVSELVAGSKTRGAFEVGLQYVGKWNSRKPQTIFCPKF